MKLIPSFLLFWIYSSESVVPGIGIWFTPTVVINTPTARCTVGEEAWTGSSRGSTSGLHLPAVVQMDQNMQNWAQASRSCQPAAGCHLPVSQCGDIGEVNPTVGLEWVHHCVLVGHPRAKPLCSVSVLESPDLPSRSRESCQREQQQNLHPGDAGLKLNSGFG